MIVLWTREAIDRLIEIEEFIGRDNAARARRFIEALIRHGESLSQFPDRGRPVPEMADAQIRELIVKDYRIVYRLNENRAEILTVFEGHRRFRLMK